MRTIKKITLVMFTNLLLLPVCFSQKNNTVTLPYFTSINATLSIPSDHKFYKPEKFYAQVHSFSDMFNDAIIFSENCVLEMELLPQVYIKRISIGNSYLKCQLQNEKIFQSKILIAMINDDMTSLKAELGINKIENFEYNIDDEDTEQLSKWFQDQTQNQLYLILPSKNKLKITVHNEIKLPISTIYDLKIHDFVEGL